MVLAFPDRWVWDFWFAQDGSTFHVFYLFAPTSLGDPDLRHRDARIGHATSNDLHTWIDKGEALGPGQDGEFDDGAVWTGSIVRSPTGEWLMFYTGARFVADSIRERIGLATSDDLTNWTKLGAVSEADPRYYNTIENGETRHEAWRDPWIIPDASGSGWKMYTTAHAGSSAPRDRGVIGTAFSEDLRRWVALPPSSAAGSGFDHLEVPQLVDLGDRTVLVFSCATPFLGADHNLDGGVWAVDVTAQDEMFPVERAKQLLTNRSYAGKIIRDQTGRLVVMAFDNLNDAGEFIGGIADPVPFDEAVGS